MIGNGAMAAAAKKQQLRGLVTLIARTYAPFTML